MVSQQPKGDGNNTDAPHNDSGHGDVLAEKKRLARRRILTGTAAAGAVLASASRAQAIGLSVCASFIGEVDLEEVDREDYVSPMDFGGCKKAIDDAD